ARDAIPGLPVRDAEPRVRQPRPVLGLELEHRQLQRSFPGPGGGGEPYATSSWHECLSFRCLETRDVDAQDDESPASAGLSSDGGRRIRTADLPGAIQAETRNGA